MFLSDKDILEKMLNGYISVKPFRKENVQNNSYLLTSNEDITIEYLQHVNVWTEEEVSLSRNYIGLLTARSSISRQGLFFATSIGVDAGFKGHLVIEFFNMSKTPFVLKKGDKMVHILFAQTSSPCTPYGGVYKDQKPGSGLENV